MQKTNILVGTAASILFSLGTLFKLMHWPGANIMRGIGLLLFAAFFVIFLLYGLKLLAAGWEKASGASASVALLLVAVSYFFKVQHWPGAGVLIGLSLAGMLIAGIILAGDAYKETDVPKQGIKALFGFAFLIITAINFLIVYGG